MVLNKTVMVSALAGLVLSASACAAPTSAEVDNAIAVIQQAVAAKSSSVESYSLKELQSMLKGAGYADVSINGDNHIIFNVDDTRYALFRMDDGDLQMYFGVTNQKLALDAINEWNRTKRLSRAYIDRDGDISLEADMLANGGLNKERVLAFVKVFVELSAPEFYRFAQSKE